MGPTNFNKIKICDNCGREIRVCNYKRHYDACVNGYKTPISKLPSYEQINGKYQCPYCKELFSNKAIGNHIWREHTKEGQEYIPKWTNQRKGQQAWNKGLTKETSPIVKRCAENLSEKYKEGILISPQKGRKLSEEEKKEISRKRIEFLQKNPDKVPYIINHSSKESYPEKIFRKALEASGIKGWKKQYRNGIYCYDFAFPELKIDVEIDGSTHLSEKVKKIDKRRDKWSKKEGWKVLRFIANDVKEDVIKCIQKLKEAIEYRKKYIRV